MTEPVENLSGQITRAADLVRLKLREWRTVNHHDVRGLLAEHDRLAAEVASLRLTLGGKTFGADVPEPVGCPAPGACAQVAELHRLRAENERLTSTMGYLSGELIEARAQIDAAGAENERLRAELRIVAQDLGGLLRAAGVVQRNRAADAALAAKGGE